MKQLFLLLLVALLFIYLFFQIRARACNLGLTTKKFTAIYELYTLYDGLSFRFRFTMDCKIRFFLK